MKKILHRKVVQDGAWYTLANLVTQISSLIGVLFVSRYLGPTNLGIYSFVQNYIAAFMTVFGGIDMYANWRIVKSENWYDNLLHYIKQKAVLTVLLLTVLVFFSIIYLPNDIIKFIPFLCIPVIVNIFSTSVFVLQYQNKAKVVTFAMITSAILLLSLKLTAVAIKLPLIYFVAINSIDGMILIIIAFYYIYTLNKNTVKTKTTPLNILGLLGDSVYPIVYVCFWYIVVRADQFFVPLYFDAYSLGIYGSAVKIIEMANVIIIIMQGVLLPRLSFLNSGSNKNKKTHITIGIYLLIGLATSSFITVFASSAVNLLFGQEFNESARVLSIYAWSIPGLFVSYLFTVLAMENKTTKILALQSIVMATITVSSLYFVSKFGSIMYISTISVGVYTLSALSLYFLWRKKYI